MEQEKPNTDANATTAEGSAPKRRSPLRRRIVYALLGSGALATLFAARPIAAAVQGGGGWHRMGMGHRWGHHRMNPDAAKEHAQVALKWALRDIEASDAQQEKVNAIVAGAIDDLFALKGEHLTNRKAIHDKLGGATIDRAGLEEVRKAEMALADQASRRLVQALADAADVLTPEQRQTLLERHRQ